MRISASFLLSTALNRLSQKYHCNTTTLITPDDYALAKSFAAERMFVIRVAKYAVCKQ